MYRSLRSVRVLRVGLVLALFGGVGSSACASKTYFSLEDASTGANSALNDRGEMYVTAGIYETYSSGNASSNPVDQTFDSHDNGGHPQYFGAPVLPEPAFYQMPVLLGLGSLGWLRRRKKA